MCATETWGEPGLLIANPTSVVLRLATAVVPDEIGDPPHYCVDDRQNRDRAPHRKPYLAAAGYVVAVATEYPIGEGPVLSKHKLTGNVGKKLQNEADPKRPEVFDNWQHRPSTGGLLLLVEQAFYSIPPGLAGCRIDEVASLAGTALHRMIGMSWFPQPWIVGLAFHHCSVRGQRNIKSRIKLDSRCGVIRHFIVPHDAYKAALTADEHREVIGLAAAGEVIKRTHWG